MFGQGVRRPGAEAVGAGGQWLVTGGRHGHRGGRRCAHVTCRSRAGWGTHPLTLDPPGCGQGPSGPKESGTARRAGNDLDARPVGRDGGGLGGGNGGHTSPKEWCDLKRDTRRQKNAGSATTGERAVHSGWISPERGVVTSGCDRTGPREGGVPRGGALILGIGDHADREVHGHHPAGEVTLTAHDSGSWKFFESIARKRFRCGDGTASAFYGG